MDYHKIPSPPETTSATTVLIRLIDGLAFRYKWAVNGLTETNLTFKPCNSSMSIIELLHHIYDLTLVTNQVLNNLTVEKNNKTKSANFLTTETLHLYRKISTKLKNMSDTDLERCTFKPKNNTDEFPFWNLINGPIADSLTHVGQITSWRRIDGNPIAKINPFLGEKISE